MEYEKYKTKKEAIMRAKKLCQTIKHNDYLYYVLDKPNISDDAYDSLMRELIAIESEYPEIKNNTSPTQRVGGKPADKFNKTQHLHKQWSFDNIFNLEELKKWDERVRKLINKNTSLARESIEYVVELKIDGLKIVLTYENGGFAIGATRGDGVMGEDVTSNVRTIRSIPLEIKNKSLFVVVGEIWFSKKEMDRINKERMKKNETPFANARNAAAGSIRQLDSRVVAQRNLDSFIYDIDKNDSLNNNELNIKQDEKLKLLKKQGFKVNTNHKICKTVGEIEEFYQEWKNKKEHEDYIVDGVVIKINSHLIQNALGYTSKAPRFAIAYKFPAEQTTTTVTDIVVQIGRTGVLTPVACLVPVKIDGSIVSRATLHNEDEIKRLDVRIGDTVIIQKAGDVIPRIVKAIKEMRNGKEKKFIMPDKCGICDGVVKKELVNAGNKKSIKHYCVNEQCLAKKIERIIHFVGKKGMDIDGMGEKIVEQLVNDKLISGFEDIFKLKIEKLEVLERFASKSAQNLITAIEKSKNVAMDKFLFSLGIRHLGEETAGLVVQNLKQIGCEKNVQDLSGLMCVFPNISIEKWTSIDGIGLVVAGELTRWFNSKKNINLLNKLNNLGIKIIIPRKSQKKESKIQGKIFVLTGTFFSMSRDEAKRYIKESGGRVSSSVSQKTDYVVVGKNSGSKYQIAKKLGVTTIKEEEFLKITENKTGD